MLPLRLAGAHCSTSRTSCLTRQSKTPPRAVQDVVHFSMSSTDQRPLSMPGPTSSVGLRNKTAPRMFGALCQNLPVAKRVCAGKQRRLRIARRCFFDCGPAVAKAGLPGGVKFWEASPCCSDGLLRGCPAKCCALCQSPPV